MSPELEVHGRIVRDQYHDSVFLMRIGEQLRVRDGIAAVGVIMATPANLELLGERELEFDGLSAASPNDVVVAVRGQREILDDALDQAENLIASPAAASQAVRYSTVDSALKANPEASLAVVSIPGEYVAKEAGPLIEKGCSVMIFSDNVSLGEEIEMKTAARQHGALVMGPDCGTAIINGVGLGFANALPRGRIGIIAASGTGAQVISTRVAALGEGVSQLIGLGGRDLTDDVGALTLEAALAELEHDAETSVIVLVGKACGPRVFGRLLTTLPELNTPLVIALQGDGPWAAASLVGAIPSTSLRQAAGDAVALVRAERPTSLLSAERLSAWRGRPSGTALRGFFAGGTLAGEALALASGVLGPIKSNLGGPKVNSDHEILDMGADEFTVNVPHPMIGPNTQADAIGQAATEGGAAVILFDVVLGYGAHEDPAGVLATAIKEARADAGGREVLFFTACVGSDDDPQRRSDQVAKLEEAGAIVLPSSDAAALAAALTASADSTKAFDLSRTDVLPAPGSAVVNVGADWFADSVRSQGAEVNQVDWRPPAGGDEELAAILDELT